MESNIHNDIIDLSHSLINELSSLYMNEKDSDLVFIIGNERIFAHKFILVLRCEYFRLMFSSGLREAIDNEVEVKETPPSAFKDVLYFMYTGRLYLKDKKIDDIIDILFLGHRYEMHDLVKSLTTYLEYNIQEDNVCIVYGTANLFNLSSLQNRCLIFLMNKGFKLLEEETFFTFSAKTLINLFSSDEFCAEEIDIFKAVIKYLKTNPDCDEQNCQKLISTIRLPLISWNDLIAYVWPSGFYLKDDLLEAKQRSEKIDNYNNYRKCVTPVRSLRSIANLINEKSALHSLPYEQNLSVIVEIPGSFTIEFDCIHFINYIELHFGSCDKSGYSYYIEVSTNGEWKKIVDMTDYHCYSTQTLYFAKTAAQFIRIYCSRSKGGGTNFIIKDFQCMIREIPSVLYNNSRNKNDLEYSTLNKNKCYAPLYGIQVDLHRSKSSSKMTY